MWTLTTFSISPSLEVLCFNNGATGQTLWGTFKDISNASRVGLCYSRDHYLVQRFRVEGPSPGKTAASSGAVFTFTATIHCLDTHE